MERKKLIIGLLGALAFTMPGADSLGAQGMEKFSEPARAALEAKRWAEAHAILERTVKQFDSRAPLLFGPKFGWFWYQKGRCEMELERWDESKNSFETCYKKYANPVGRNPAETSWNHHALDALRGLGDVAFQTGKVKEAAVLYRMWFQEHDAAKLRQEQQAKKEKQKKEPKKGR